MENSFRALPRSADFQVGCVADFQIGGPGKALRVLELRRNADLEIGDTAGLETRATGRAFMRPKKVQAQIFHRLALVFGV